MARTTATKVKEILDNSALSDAIVNAYITGANELVTEVLGSDTTISDALKEEIERWLTAHMISVTRERMAKREGAGGAEIEYTGEYGEGLKSSPYGQMVLTLDSTGKMAALSGQRARITAITSFD